MKKKISVVVFFVAFLLSFLKLDIVFAESKVFSLEDAKIIDKTEEVKVNSFTFKGESVNSDITFFAVDGYVEYKLVIKNNAEEDYVIKGITDDNKSENITYEYDKHENYKIAKGETFELKIKAKYNKEEKDITKREKEDQVSIKIDYENEEGKTINQTITINPNTSDKIIPIIIVLIISAIILIVLIKKKKASKKVISILIALTIIMPTIALAATNNEIKINSKYRLNDKLEVTVDIAGEKTKKVVKYNESLSIEEPNIEGKNFEKWILSDGSDFDITSKITEDIEIIAVLEDKVATLQPGKDVLLTIFKTAGVDAYFENIALEDEPSFYILMDDEGLLWSLELNKIKKATKEEYNSVKDNLTDENIISLEDSENVYVWYNEDEHTSYYYSEAKKIYLNEDSSYLFFNLRNLEEIDLSVFDTSKVENMQAMFGDCSSLTSLDVSHFDTSNVKYMNGMFEGCSSLTELDVSSFDTSKVENMQAMFSFCGSLTSLDVSHFDTSKVTDMSHMFWLCGALISIDVTHFDTSNVKYMNGMFADSPALKEIDVSSFDTSKVENMQAMFGGCSSLTSLDVSHFDTSKVTDMDNMFYSCSSLTELDVSSFDTSNVTDMGGMFYNCSSLTSLDVSSFDTSNVTYMYGMFNNCSSLTSLDVSSFDTSNATYMGSMFNNCSSLTSLDVSSFDTSNVTNMNYMFCDCSSLTELDVSSFDTSKVTFMESMFKNCTSLVTIYVSDKFVVTQDYWNSHSMFDNCTSIKGGAGTAYNSIYTYGIFGRIDDPSHGKPGYFTAK